MSQPSVERGNCRVEVSIPIKELHPKLNDICVRAFTQVSVAYPASVGSQAIALELYARRGDYAPFQSFYQIYEHITSHDEVMRMIVKRANYAHQMISEKKVENGEEPLHVAVPIDTQGLIDVLHTERELLTQALRLLTFEAGLSGDENTRDFITRGLEALLDVVGEQPRNLDWLVKEAFQGVSRGNKPSENDPVVLEIFHRLYTHQLGVQMILHQDDEE
jgi:hypothetical protein